MKVFFDPRYMLFTIGWCYFLNAESEKVTRFIDNDLILAQSLPTDLQGKPLVHLKTLALQQDNFSCGYHALFNAIAIDQAVKDEYNFESRLRNNLCNRDLFFKTIGTIKNHVKDNKPLNSQEIITIAQQLGINNRLLCLFFNDFDQLMMPYCDVSVTYPLTLSAVEIQKLMQEKQKEAVHEAIVKQFKAVKNREIHAGHFICNTGNHWMLFSVLRNSHGQLKVYLIGAWNEPFEGMVKKYAHYFMNLIEVNNL